MKMGAVSHSRVEIQGNEDMNSKTKKTESMRLTQSMAIFFISIYVIIHMGLIFYIGPYAWDDGAIGLAFGKTLGGYGKFSLTNASEIVEGASSIFLVFLSALVYNVFRLDFYDLITWSQINALIFSISTVILTYNIIGSKFGNKNYALFIVILLSAFPTYTAEIMNGMEMTIFSVFLLLLIICHEYKSKWIFLILPLLLLTRYESIFYLLFSYAAIFLFSKNDRKYIFNIILYILLVFMIFSFFRYVYFGTIIPNTILAKMHPPQTPPGFFLKINRKLAGGLEFMSVFNFIIVIGTFLFVIKKDKRSDLSDVKLWMIISFFIFSLITGTNWGHGGRMFLGVFPIMVIFLVKQLSDLTNIRLQFSDQTREFEINEKYKFYIISGTLFTALLFNSSLFYINVKSALYGGYFQHRPLPKEVIDRLRESNSHSLVTPENYKITGMAVDKLRDLLGLDTIKFMVPDVGGLGLCCDKINVIDSAKLTNKYLAKNGYSDYDKFLRLEDPVVIETHGLWSKVTNIYSSEFFKENFYPFVFNNTLLWLNKKYLNKINENPVVDINQIIKSEIPMTTRYFRLPIDIEFIHSYLGKIYSIKLKNDNNRIGNFQ